MEYLSYDIIFRIMNMVGLEIFPDKFYKLRLVSKCFRDNINLFKGGFYHSLKNNFKIENGEYDLFIKNMKKFINLEFGRKILELDNWTISDDYDFVSVKYPKYIKDHYNQWIYLTKPDVRRTDKKPNSDYSIEIYIFERYYNKMKVLQNKFKKVNNEVVIQWLKQNGE